MILSTAYEYFSRTVEMRCTCEKTDASEVDIGEKYFLLRRVCPVSYHGRTDEKGNNLCKNNKENLNKDIQENQDDQEKVNELERKGKI